ncbi:isoamylase early set domain-containing protein [Chloroflexi bacterium TSY]|nr:isoamylase early set domain-containing protein [Chloroflexi bacterium TSY]
MIRRRKVKNSDQIKVTFALPEDYPHMPQAVVGDFNHWDSIINPMKRRSNYTYSATVTLKSGQRYAFRYLCEGDHWCNEEEADAFEPNEFGSENSVLIT